MFLISTTAATANATGTHPIEYHVGCSPTMVNDGTSLNYFIAHGFTAVHLVVPDTGTYQAELNKIKSLGMKPIIDVEVPIWNGGQLASTPITSFASYFQSLKNAGWEYVSSEGGRSGDLDFMSQYFKGYVNYNCDQCGLWGSGWATPPYKHSLTVTNSWESYYTSEWSYIQTGATQAAALGKQNGILAGVWEYGSDGVDYNPILTNAKNGGSPSYKSMLDWSYDNGVGFTHFHVWFGLNQDLSRYKALGFEEVVANLQTYYPATSSAKAQTSVTLSTSNANPASGQSYTLSGRLNDSNNAGLANKAVQFYWHYDGQTDWTPGPTVQTTSTGSFSWSDYDTKNVTYKAAFAGDSSYAASSDEVTVTVATGSNPTHLDLSSSNYNPGPGESYTLSGSLTDGDKGLANKPVQFYWHYAGQTDWTSGPTVQTTSTGSFSWSDYDTKNVTYKAAFAGDSSYASSSAEVTVTVATGSNPTQITLSTSNANPASGQSYTLSGTLKDSNNAGLANKPVQFFWHYAGQTDWTPGPTVQTTSTGAFSWSDYDTKNVTYKAAFAGESSYAASTSNVVTINVQ